MYLRAIDEYRDAPAINQAMGRVYAHMMAAIVNSMLVSYLVGSSPALVEFFFGSWIKYLVIFAPLTIIL